MTFYIKSNGNNRRAAIQAQLEKDGLDNLVFVYVKDMFDEIVIHANGTGVNKEKCAQSIREATGEKVTHDFLNWL